MKKVLFMLFMLLVLGACSKEKANFEAVLTDQLKDDSDLADYNLNPEEIAGCVVGKVSSSLPGFSWSPKNDTYYHAYSRLLKTKDDANEVKSTLEETKEVFGSEKKAMVAVGDITNYVMECMGDAIARRG